MYIYFMVRIIRGNVAKKRRKSILKLAKSYKGTHSKLFRTANQQVLKAKCYSYVGRKLIKRVQRQKWISCINTYARRQGKNYSLIISTLKKQNIALNNKILTNFIINDPVTFDYLVFNNC